MWSKQRVVNCDMMSQTCMQPCSGWTGRAGALRIITHVALYAWVVYMNYRLLFFSLVNSASRSISRSVIVGAVVY